MSKIRRAELSRTGFIISATVILAITIAWMLRHIVNVVSVGIFTENQLDLVWMISFVLITWTAVLALLERPKKVNKDQSAQLNQLKVAVLIPAYNEDPDLLLGCIQSMLRQTRKIDSIIVIDDGSKLDYKKVLHYVARLSEDKKQHIKWFRTENGGKRHAQVVGMKNSPDADIFITVDSDTILDPKAAEEGLKPFINNKVQSVAGICLPLNVDENFLTRFTGLWETVWQVLDRSAQSTMSSVTVNSGVLAFYRAETIRPYINSYLSETFFGRHVKFSDDSLLTMYSMTHGKTVQQPTSLCFSAVPNKYSHHIRRYIRWMRGSFIRTWWRFKYLPMRRYVYWLHLVRWVQFVISTTVLIYLIQNGTMADAELIPFYVAVPVLIGFMQNLRYFMIKRNDITLKSEILTYLTTPMVIIWSLTIMKFVKFYAYATVYNNKWGTRESSTPEVSLKGGL